MAVLPDAVLRAVAQTLGDSDDCFSRAQLSEIGGACGIPITFSDVLTSQSLYEALREQQLRANDLAGVAAFLRAAMNPARFAGDRNHFERLRAQLNTDLSGTDLEITESGVSPQPGSTWSAQAGTPVQPTGAVQFSFGIVVSVTLLFMVPQYLYTLFGVTGRGSTVEVIIPIVIGIVFGSAVTAALVFVTVQELRGVRPSVGELISRGFALLIPVIPVVLVSSILIAVGFVLLIIPGLMLSVWFWVAIPVAVIEKPGISGSLQRSVELTSGYRWPIFGIVLLLAALAFLAGWILQQIFLSGGITNTADLSVYVIIDWLITGFLTTIGAVVAGVGYYCLRSAKEGTDIDQIARVFD
jgi:hypothetical protein